METAFNQVWFIYSYTFKAKENVSKQINKLWGTNFMKLVSEVYSSNSGTKKIT